MLLLLAFTNLTFAKPPGCPVAANPVVKRSVPVPTGTSFFIRAAPATREVAFATGDRSPSRVIDLDHPKNERMVDGDLDPVLSPDGDLLTVPQSIYVNHRTGRREFNHGNSYVKPDYLLRDDGKLDLPERKGLANVSLEEAKRQGKTVQMPSALTFYNRDQNRDFKPAYFDTQHMGGYQSVGTLSRNDESAHYRVLLSGSLGFQMRDYHYDRRTGEVSPTNDPRVACASASADTGSMPVLAPDGRTMSYYDVTDQTTHVLAIADQGKCTRVDSIPALVGKPSFSPDGRLMAFHVNRGSNENVELLWPQSGDKLGIWIFDRETKRMIPIATAEDANNYYPVFLSNNEIAFLHATDAHKMSIDITELNLRQGGVACRDCDETDARRFTAAVLGAMYNAHCEGPPLTMGTGLLGLEDLTPETCRSFVNTLKPEDIADEPTLAGIKVTTPKASAPRGRFAGLVARVRSLFEATPEVKPRRKPMKFVNRRAPTSLKIEDLLDICDRLTVTKTSGPSANAAH